MQSATETFITQFGVVIAMTESSEPGVVEADTIQDLTGTLTSQMFERSA